MSQIKPVQAKLAKQWLDNQEAVLVDVREPEEYNTMHIAGASLIPLRAITQDKLPEHGHKKIIIHCQLGKRGAIACEKLLEKDPDLDVYNLEGGIIAWQQAGFAVEQSDEEIISIERQFQVLIGGGVLFGLITGYLIAPVFYFLALFCGAGLLYTGLTGNLVLLNLLKNMPWNENR